MEKKKFKFCISIDILFWNILPFICGSEMMITIILVWKFICIFCISSFLWVSCLPRDHDQKEEMLSECLLEKTIIGDLRKIERSGPNNVNRRSKSFAQKWKKWVEAALFCYTGTIFLCVSLAFINAAMISNGLSSVGQDKNFICVDCLELWARNIFYPNIGLEPQHYTRTELSFGSLWIVFMIT